MNIDTEKIVDMDQYRRQPEKLPGPGSAKDKEDALREMAYHMHMALQYAKKLLH